VTGLTKYVPCCPIIITWRWPTGRGLRLFLFCKLHLRLPIHHPNHFMSTVLQLLKQEICCPKNLPCSHNCRLMGTNADQTFSRYFSNRYKYISTYFYYYQSPGQGRKMMARILAGTRINSCSPSCTPHTYPLVTNFAACPSLHST